MIRNIFFFFFVFFSTFIIFHDWKLCHCTLSVASYQSTQFSFFSIFLFVVIEKRCDVYLNISIYIYLVIFLSH